MHGRRLLAARVEPWLAAIMVVVVFTSCSVRRVTFTASGEPGDAGLDAGPAGAARVSVTVQREGTAAGVVSAGSVPIVCNTECVATVAYGTTLTLTARPEPGGRFSGWSGAGCAGLDNACTLTVIADVAITARFDAAAFTVGVELTGDAGGSVTSRTGEVRCPGACTISVPYRTVLELDPHPALAATFGGWGGACTGTGTGMVTVTADTSVTAAFTAENQLIVAPAGNGHGTVSSDPPGILCGMDCEQGYAPGTVVTLTALPDPDSTFIGWSGDAGCTGVERCVVPMDRAAVVTAQFGVRGGLFAINDVTGHLERIDPVTLVATDVGPLGVPYALGDCAWDLADSTLYVVDGRGDRALYRVNLASGAATLVGVHGLTDLFALAYHPVTGRIYGIASDLNRNLNLYTLDPATGAATLVGPTQHPNNGPFNGMVWDSRRNRLVALTSGGTAFFAIDVATGQATELSAPGFLDSLGLAYDPAGDRLWVADIRSSFFQFDPDSFTRVPLGTAPGKRSCLAFVPSTPLSAAAPLFWPSRTTRAPRASRPGSAP